MFRWVGALAVFVLAATAARGDDVLTRADFAFSPTGHIIVAVEINDIGPFSFIVDTAASRSVIFDTARAQLDLGAPIRVDQAIVGANAVAQADVYATEVFEFAGVEFVDVSIVALEDWALDGWRPDGVLGVDVLARFQVEFAIEARSVLLRGLESDIPPDYRRRRSARLTPQRIGAAESPLYFLTVRFDGRPATTILDLGSSTTIMNWAMARRLGFAPHREPTETEIQGAINGGEPAAIVPIRRIRVGRADWRRRQVTVTDLPVFDIFGLEAAPSAILGADLLGEQDFLIDFAGNRLYVK